MTAYDFVHLAILGLGGEVKGSTKLQKLVYFLGVTTGQLTNLGYRPHYYGPYSDDVADAVNQLQSLGFLTQNSAGGGSFDRQGFEFVRYDHKLTGEGRKLAEEKRKQHPQLWKQIENGIAILKRGNEQDYVKLSIAAKTYFLLGETTKRPSQNEVSVLAQKFGWSVAPKQVQDAAEYLEKLGLIKK